MKPKTKSCGPIPGGFILTHSTLLPTRCLDFKRFGLELEAQGLLLATLKQRRAGDVPQASAKLGEMWLTNRVPPKWVGLDGKND